MNDLLQAGANKKAGPVDCQSANATVPCAAAFDGNPKVASTLLSASSVGLEGTAGQDLRTPFHRVALTGRR